MASSAKRRSLGETDGVRSLSENPSSLKSKIANASWFKGFLFSERVMLATLSSEEIHDRLKETWATQGVVSGLIAGITVEGLLSPPSFVDGKL